MKDFKPKQDTTVAESFDPSQDNINKRTKRFEVDGIKVALLSKKNRGETVNVAIAMRIGNEKALFGQATNATLANRMLTRGTTKFTREQLSDEFERLKISGRISGPGGGIQTTRPNLDAALRLVAHVLREPTFPESEFEQLRNQVVTSITASLSEPEARASDAMSRHFNIYPRGDWRSAASLEESLADVKAAKLEHVKRFHRDFFGASPAQIAIVGDFDEAQATALIKELFAGWKPVVPYQRVTTEYRDVPPAAEAIRTPEKENAIFVARENVNLRDDDPDYPALFVADYILGGGAGFESRLMTRIRQKEGLSYGVGSELAVGPEDRAGSWTAYAIAAPQNVAKVETAFREELARALKDGFTNAEVASAQTGIVSSRMQTRSQDAALAGAWTGNLYLGRTFEWSKEFEQKVIALTPAQVTAALRKYVDPAKLTIVKAGDFKQGCSKLEHGCARSRRAGVGRKKNNQRFPKKEVLAYHPRILVSSSSPPAPPRMADRSCRVATRQRCVAVDSTCSTSHRAASPLPAIRSSRDLPTGASPRDPSASKRYDAIAVASLRGLIERFRPHVVYDVHGPAWAVDAASRTASRWFRWWATTTGSACRASSWITACSAAPGRGTGRSASDA